MVQLHKALLIVLSICPLGTGRPYETPRPTDALSWRVVCTPITKTQPRPKCLVYPSPVTGPNGNQLCPAGLHYQAHVQLCVSPNPRPISPPPTAPQARRATHQGRECWPPQPFPHKGDKCVTSVTPTRDKTTGKNKDSGQTAPPPVQVTVSNATVSSQSNKTANNSSGQQVTPAASNARGKNQCRKNQEYFPVCSKGASVELSKVSSPCCCDVSGCTLLRPIKEPCPSNSVYDFASHRCRISCKEGLQFDKNGRGCRPKPS